MNVAKLSRTTISVVGLVAVGIVGVVGGAAAVENHSAGQSVDTQLSNTPGTGKAIAGEEAAAAYLQEQRSFPFELPEGVDWPEALPSNLLEPEVSMEPNVPRGVASFFWLCAWEYEYLSTDNKSEALTMITKFVELPFYPSQFVDPERVWHSSVIEPALRGEPSGIASDYDGCAYFRASVPEVSL